HGLAAFLAVDRNRPQQREAPAEERNPQQFPLQYPDLNRKYFLEHERFPRRLMLAENDGVALRNVFPALDLIIEAATDLEPPQRHAGPLTDDPIPIGEGQHNRKKAGYTEHDGEYRPTEGKHQRPDDHHRQLLCGSVAISASATALRSA